MKSTKVIYVQLRSSEIDYGHKSTAEVTGGHFKSTKVI